MPKVPFFLIAGIFVAIMISLKNVEKNRLKEEVVKETEEKAKASQEQSGIDQVETGKSVPAEFEKLIETDIFALEIGYNLLSLADKSQGGDLLKSRVTGVRKRLPANWELVPPIAVRDNLGLESNGYRFLLHNKEIARGELMPNRWMAMNVSNSEAELNGILTTEPVFGIESVWVMKPEKKNAEISGFSIVDSNSVLVTHLSETLKNNAMYLISRQDVQGLIDHVEQSNRAYFRVAARFGQYWRYPSSSPESAQGKRIHSNLTLVRGGCGFLQCIQNPDDLSSL